VRSREAGLRTRGRFDDDDDHDDDDECCLADGFWMGFVTVLT
jgi:hypothetical protein